MIRMEVADENRVQNITTQAVTQQLATAALATVKEEMPLIKVYIYTAEAFVWKWKARPGAKDDKLHGAFLFFF